MRAVCAAAALGDRYFYESFADRDALLAAVWDAETQAIVAAVGDGLAVGGPDVTSMLRAALAAVVTVVADDGVRARIVFGDHGGSALLEARRSALLGSLTGLILDAGRPFLAPQVDPAVFELRATVGVGGFGVVLAAWATEARRDDAWWLVEQATALGIALVEELLVAPGLPGRASE